MRLWPFHTKGGYFKRKVSISMDIAFLFFFFLKDKWLGDGEGWEGKLCDASWQAELS